MSSPPALSSPSAGIDVAEAANEVLDGVDSLEIDDHHEDCGGSFDDLPDFGDLAAEDPASTAQRQRAEKIASLLTYKKGDDPTLPTLHPLAEQRVLHEGILIKRGTKALMKRTNPRHVFVFSEAVLITKLSGNKFLVNSALPLSWITLMDTVYLDGALPHSFCIVAPERSFELKAADAEGKSEPVRPNIVALRQF